MLHDFLDLWTLKEVLDGEVTVEGKWKMIVGLFVEVGAAEPLF